MGLELHVTSGTLAGHRLRFTQSVVLAGRHPECDLRFDANRDLDVSTRHAEFIGGPDGWLVRDLGSTNGTFLNGQRITSPARIRERDVVAFGSAGPALHILAAGAVASGPRTRVDDTAMDQTATAGAPAQKTEERIAVAVAAQTTSLRRFVVAMTAVVVAGVGTLVWMNQRTSAAAREAIAAILARNDSLGALLTSISAREAGLDSAARALTAERRELAQSLRSASDVNSASSRIEALDRRASELLVASTVDYRQIAAENGRAVAFLAVEEPGGRSFSGTAFGITTEGLLVTNRHVVLDDEGRPPRRLGVYFADDPRFLPAHLVRIVVEHDLAFIQITTPGRYPAVRGITSSADIAPGDPIAVIGFPLGTTLPQDGGTMRASLTAGIVSKSSALCAGRPCMQIDAFAAEGSSGSPVFDARGLVVGVLFGGAPESGGRAVYTVPSTHLIANLPAEGRSAIR